MQSSYIGIYVYDQEVGEDEQIILSDEQIVQDLQEIKENVQLQQIKEEVVTEEVSTEEASTEEANTEEAITDGVIFLDENVDSKPYLSSEVQNASVNDLYSIALSTRNILLLFVLFFFCYKIFGSLKNVIYRLMDK